ncbi:hypothetical protein ACMFMF_009291 [Clarireedia jacksonii]
MNIQSVNLLPGVRRPLDVFQGESGTPGIPADLDWSNNPVKYVDSDTIYDASTNPTIERPTVILHTPDSQYIRITVTGWSQPTDVQYKIYTTGLQYTSIESNWTESAADPASTGGTMVFHAAPKLSQGRLGDIPLLFKGPFEWYLVQLNADGSNGQVVFTQTIPMELYILNYELPSYFDDGVPLLLLRMFIDAAMLSGITTQQDWIALVVKICHGSAAPLTGVLQSTERHWLKYNTIDGSPSFVDGSSDIILPFNNYGGVFYLNAWLNAYRNYLAHDTLSAVNCFDQAGIVELALSLGMDYNTVAWEYCQPYGYIKPASQLVGWGACNNPYFKKITENKIVDEQSSTRQPFTNHAFLVWGPNFHPEKMVIPTDPRKVITLPPDASFKDGSPRTRVVENFFDENYDPNVWSSDSANADVTLYAIDACAGPHLGTELRQAYYDGRDSNYNEQSKFTTELNKNLTHHYWTPGITGLSGRKTNAQMTLLPTNSLFAANAPIWADFKAAPNSTAALQVYGGKIAAIQQFFNTTVQNTIPPSSSTGVVSNGNAGTWKPITIASFVSNGNTVTETKLYENVSPALEYLSLVVTVTPSNAAACEKLQGRAEWLLITSNLKEEDFTLSKNPTGDATKSLNGDFISLFVHANLCIEISTYSYTAPLPGLVQTVGNWLQDASLVDPTQWQQCLS